MPALAERAYPKLTHPPLTEALIDIRIREDLPASILAKLTAPRNFPVAKEIKQGQFQFRVGKDEPAQAKVISDAPFGWRYDKDDGSEVVQLRRNGLTYSILKNYNGWDVLRLAARDQWERFVSISGLVNISRLAVRYINGITIPLGADYDEYLTTAPRVPRSIPPIVTSFMQRVLVPVEEAGATAIITQTLEMPAPAVLDLDIFSECSLEGKSPEVWVALDKLRDVVDKIFFSSLTE